MDIFDVTLSKQAENDLKKTPSYIVFKLQAWISGVKNCGLREIKKQPGFHDEPLKGDRLGQRSIRLNKAYRAIYVIDKSRATHFIEVITVNKHDY